MGESKLKQSLSPVSSQRYSDQGIRHYHSCLFPSLKSTNGKYTGVVGAYTGCLKEGGQEIAKETVTIEFTEDNILPTIKRGLKDSGDTTLLPKDPGVLFFLGIGVAVVGAVISFSGQPFLGIPLGLFGISMVIGFRI